MKKVILIAAVLILSGCGRASTTVIITVPNHAGMQQAESCETDHECELQPDSLAPELHQPARWTLI